MKQVTPKKHLETPDDQLFSWHLMPFPPRDDKRNAKRIELATFKLRNRLSRVSFLTHESPLFTQDVAPVEDEALMVELSMKRAHKQALKNPTESPFVLCVPLLPGDFDSPGLVTFRSTYSRLGGSSMADEIPVIPKVNDLEVRTGNIVNWNRLKRKPNTGSTAELTECITATVKNTLDSANKTQLQYEKELLCSDSSAQHELPADDRGELKVIIKLFICSHHQEPSVIREVMKKVREELDVEFVETVLLSLSMYECEDQVTVEELKPYWQELEELVGQEQILSIGVSDLDKKKLDQLYTWASVKPCINQVNLASCCVMPKDMTDYAKQVDIQLQTHNDPPELLPSSQLQAALRQCGAEQDAFGWNPLWVARYSVLVKCRGIIKSKGYIMRAERDPHLRV